MTASTSTLTRTPPTDATAPMRRLPAGEVLRAVSSLVAGLDPDDDAWTTIGPHVTAIVDATRRATVGTGSPIRPGEEVPAVLRLRDLACAAQRVAGNTAHAVGNSAVASHLAAVTAARRGA